MTAVRFIRDHDRYMRGEVAGFRPAEAERLVRRKIARFYRPAAEATTPAAAPPEVSSPSAPEVPQDGQGVNGGQFSGQRGGAISGHLVRSEAASERAPIAP